MTRLKYTIFNNLYLLILVIIITSDRLFHLSMPYFILGLILFVAVLIYQYHFFSTPVTQTTILKIIALQKWAGQPPLLGVLSYFF